MLRFDLRLSLNSIKFCPDENDDIFWICPSCGYTSIDNTQRCWIPNGTKYVKFLCRQCRDYNYKINIVCRSINCYEFFDKFENLIKQREIG